MDYGVFYLKVTGYLKTFILIMANVKLVFCGDSETENTSKEMQMYVNQFSKLYISITDVDVDSYDNFQYTCLDKQTAIKLSKELRKQIALMD